MVLRIGDVYLLYNIAEGINADTAKFMGAELREKTRNGVVLVRGVKDGRGSMLLGGIKEQGDSLRVKINNSQIMFKVCSV